MADQLLSIEDSSLTAIADAIRTKGGTNVTLEFPNGFVSALQAIETEATVTPKNAPSSAVTLTPSSTSYSIPQGFLTGTQTVQIQLETGSANPGSSQVTYTPSSGKFFRYFTVGGIGNGTRIVTGTKTGMNNASEMVISDSDNANITFNPTGVIIFLLQNTTEKVYQNRVGSYINIPGLSPHSNGYSWQSTSNNSVGIVSVSASYGTKKVTLTTGSNNRFIGDYFYLVMG